jgi:hypothetical protein
MSALLLLKVTLAPSLVAAASLAGRRFGPKVGGWLIGFPLVAGPVLWFYAREQGAAFAARAAAGTLLGVLSLCVFLLAYAWSALRWPWPAGVVLGWVGFAAAALAIARVPALANASWPICLAAAFAALALTMWTLPRVPAAASAPRPRHDLPWRMLATAVLVVSLTAVAHLLGPSLSGLFTPFPIATSVLVVFAHREAGPAGVIAVLDGFMPSLFSFSSFCAALSFALDRWRLPAAFGFALLVSLASQTIVLRGLARRARPSRRLEARS